MKDVTFKKLEGFVEFCIRRRMPIMIIFGLLTLGMVYFAAQIEVKTIFNDLLPTEHEYIKINNRFKSTFGGSNMVSIMLEVEEGTIFDLKVLKKLKVLQQELRYIDGVNQYQIISLASRKIREIRASNEGIVSKPIMWPKLPETEGEMAHLRDSVLENRLVYGRYVSVDLKAVLLTVDFYDHLLNYSTAYPEILEVVKKVEGDGVKIRVAGEPVLYGWVNHYIPETKRIFLYTIIFMLLLLILLTRTWRGTLLPLLAGIVSTVWALGITTLIGFSLDPLLIVLAFLITAQTISHAVQLITRFDDEIALGAESPEAAAKAAMLGMFKPGMLGVATDAACAGVVVFLTSIPMLQKVSIIGAIWVGSIAITGVIMTPILTSWCKKPKGFAHPINIYPLVQKILGFAIYIVTSRWRYVVLSATTIIFVFSGIYALNLTVGDANPGSPILWPDSKYNTDWDAINTKFQGSDRMFVVLSGKEKTSLKEKAVLKNMEMLQRYIEAQPKVGGSLSFADVIPGTKRMLREDNPRYKEFGLTVEENGETLYMFTSGTEPGDMDRYSDPNYRNYGITMFFQDHQGGTIRTAIARVKEFVEDNPLEDATYHLAGGLIGVLAAVNEVILSGQIQAIAFSLLIVVILCIITFRSLVAGMFFMVPVIIANTLTFSFMTYKNIGMNINTVPVVALGIGLGIDYAVYIVNSIREELHKDPNLMNAIAKALSGAGRAVFVTAATLTGSVFLWCFSSLRFQAEMGILIALWLFIAATTSIFVMPAIVYVFRPEFIVGKETLEG